MVDTIYVEKEVLNHPRAQRILLRFKNAQRIECERYGEVFNHKSQNFRLQKQKSALILAKKHSNFVIKTPQKYGIGNAHNYYFSHMLNCIYDCRYCFLQGMYRSAHYVIFVNFEDFQSEIETTVSGLNGERATFFSGYDGDSLALDNLTHFSEDFIKFFENFPSHEIELRTKSNLITPLLKRPPISNAIIAFSLNNEYVTKKFEHRTPSFEKRLNALKKLQEHGWPIGLRFDPLIYHTGWEQAYEKMIEQTFSLLDAKKIHSVTLGAFRMPHPIYKNMATLYPDEPLFFSKLHSYNEGVSYQKKVEEQMRSFCQEKLNQHLTNEQFFLAAF